MCVSRVLITESFLSTWKDCMMEYLGLECIREQEKQNRRAPS